MILGFILIILKLAWNTYRILSPESRQRETKRHDFFSLFFLNIFY